MRMHSISKNSWRGSPDFLEEIQEAGGYIHSIKAQDIIPYADDYGGNLYCFNMKKINDGEPEIVLWDHERSEDEGSCFEAENFCTFIEDGLKM